MKKEKRRNKRSILLHNRWLNEGKKVLSNDNLWPQWGGVTQRNARNFLLKFRVTALPSIFHSGFSREMVIRSFKVTSREQIGGKKGRKKSRDRITAFILSSPLPIFPFIDINHPLSKYFTFSTLLVLFFLQQLTFLFLALISIRFLP